MTLIDVLMNSSSSVSSLPPQRIDLRLENSAASQTRLNWQSAQPLRGWQFHWKLSGAQQDQPLHSVRFGEFDVHWKVTRSVLSVLVWSSAFLPPGTESRAGEIVLPFVLEAQGVFAASGLSDVGKMVKLEAQVLADGNAPPRAFSLSPAFPNPLLRGQQRVVEWRYELPQDAPVEFKIFNLLGQEMRRAVLGTQPAGRGHWQWDGRDQRGRVLASGLYFVEFTAGHFKKRERMLLR
jgi:hypothetical protein